MTSSNYTDIGGRLPIAFFKDDSFSSTTPIELIEKRNINLLDKVSVLILKALLAVMFVLATPFLFLEKFVSNKELKNLLIN